MNRKCIGNRSARRVDQNPLTQQNVIIIKCHRIRFGTRDIHRPEATAKRNFVADCAVQIAEIVVACFHIGIRCGAEEINRHADVALVIGNVQPAVREHDLLPRAVVRLYIDIGRFALVACRRGAGGRIGHGAVAVVSVRVVYNIAALRVCRVCINKVVVPIKLAVPLLLRFQFKRQPLHGDLREIKPEPDLLGARSDPVLARPGSVEGLVVRARHIKLVRARAAVAAPLGLPAEVELVRACAARSDVIQAAVARAVGRQRTVGVSTAARLRLLEHQHFAHARLVFDKRGIRFLVIFKARDVGNGGRDRVRDPAGAVLRKDLDAQAVRAVQRDTRCQHFLFRERHLKGAFDRQGHGRGVHRDLG